MKIDLTDIKNEQKSLDDTIYKNHNITRDSIMEELYLALAVELGELANEIRCFKFWSFKKPSEKSIILDEYADGIHFVTSISIKYDLPLIFDIDQRQIFDNKKEITKIFNHLFMSLQDLKDPSKVLKWFSDYLKLGLALGFSIEEIKSAYQAKHETNLQRQKNNY